MITSLCPHRPSVKTGIYTKIEADFIAKIDYNFFRTSVLVRFSNTSTHVLVMSNILLPKFGECLNQYTGNPAE
jgi:hypothetical protein